MEYDENFVLIGEIVAAVGIKGEVKVKSYSDEPSRFADLDCVFLSQPQDETSLISDDMKRSGTSPAAPPRKMTMESSRVQRNMAVLKLRGVEDRNSAEDLRGSGIYIDESQLRELPDDTYYLRDLIGLMVYRAGEDSGPPIGKIKDVLQTGPHDIYVIERSDLSGADILVPAVKEFIKDINIDHLNPENSCVHIKFIEGMI